MSTWKPLQRIFDIDRQIEKAFDEIIHKPWGVPIKPEAICPPIDLFETSTEYLLVADLPGVKPGEVTLEITGDEIVIRGGRSRAREMIAPELIEGVTVKIERERGEFFRRIRFASPIDAERAESSFEDGQLRIRLPKRHDANPRHDHE